MKKFGIITEYNPFHNGHSYQISEIKRIFNPDLLVTVSSGNITMRGEISMIDKFNKAKIAVKNGVDLFVELPLVYSLQSADFFAYYSVYLLNLLKIDNIVAGSESCDIEFLEGLVDILETNSYKELLKANLKLGDSFKLASTKAIYSLTNKTLEPNDTLNLCYLKAIKKINKNIKFHLIKRSVGFYDKNSTFASASYIRNSLDYKNYVVKETLDLLDNGFINKNENYYDLIKYSLINNDLSSIQNLNEGLDNYFSNLNINELTFPINSKRYTTSRINRALFSILLNIKNNTLKEIDYIRVLSMNVNGKNYLNQIKKEIKIYTNIKNNINEFLDLEIKLSRLYSLYYKIDISKYEFNNPYILIE